ncbi:hypothetical protein DWG14_00120 [Streptomyces griseorubiginosus]|uniref:Peptidase inhibitor family I36 n=2 Tax=Streptomyces griseorubiginosus TaxID=67304 RepID=A0AAI8KUC4_9ACTN|nr:hypothetical protein DWG14_00120 [Streptomyces griseorubiginosus]
MRNMRSIIGFFGVLAVALAALFVAGPAQAAPQQGAAKDGHVLVLPAAPAGVTPRSAAANSPTTSPAAGRVVHVASGSTVNCTSGSLCTAVWDPTTGDWKVFFLYNCARYSLSYWNGGGYYVDSQTGGVTSYFYGQSGNVLKRFTPDNTVYSYDWTPVWSIRNC